MKQRLRLLIVVVSIIVSINGCKASSSPFDHPNLLVSVEGETRLKRKGWSEYTSVGFGTILRYDDLLKVNGTVTILCGNLTLKTLDSGTNNCPCPPGPCSKSD